MDTGLQSLVAIARFHQLPHQFGEPGKDFSNTEILLAAKVLMLRAKLVSPATSKLNNPFLPAIAKSSDGHHFILARIATNTKTENLPTGENKAVAGFLVHDLRKNAPKTLTVDDFEKFWHGELIALTRLQGLVDSLQQKIDISWFIPTLVKCRKIFTEVLIVTFFLQIFTLVTPRFFQVVMDKVLLHKGFTTLDVLAVGFFVVVVSESVLGGIRNNLFSHTTKRVDVEQGSRLYNHLMGLPLACFESRQVGQNIACVHELELELEEA